jgi:flagellar motor switch protein FliN/FliY
VRDLTQFGVGSVLMLDKQVDDPVDLYVGDRLIGQGVLEVSEEDGRAQLSVRLVDIAELKDAT